MTQISKASQVAALANDIVSVKDFGAVGDGVTDDTAAIQAALDTGSNVTFPKGSFLCGEVAINTRGVVVQGQGKHLTAIIPNNQASTRAIFKVGNERVSIRGFWFKPASYTKGIQDVSNTARPIWFENMTNVDAALTWVDVSDNVFENIRGAAIYIKSPLRESWIYNNNFIGMGNPTTGEGVIEGDINETFVDNINNVWIYKNTFYRAATPFINLEAVNGSTPSKHFCDSMWIEENLFHGQLLDVTTNDGSSGVVQAEPTDQVYVQSCSRLRIRNNTFTSYHGEHSAIRVGILTTFQENDDVIVTDNCFACDDNGSYTGVGVLLIDCTSNIVTNNVMVSGRQTLDIRVWDTGTFSINPRVKVENNVPTEGTPIGVSLPSAYNIHLQSEEHKQLTSLEVTSSISAESMTSTDVQIQRSGTEVFGIGVAQVTINYAVLGLQNLVSASYAINLSSNYEHPVYWRGKATTGFTLNRLDTSVSQQVDWTVIV